MIHSPLTASSPNTGLLDFAMPCAGSARLNDLHASVERAKRKASDSLRRAQATPQPHATSNLAFIALYEEHLRDRELLFSTMRQFDDARKSELSSRS